MATGDMDGRAVTIASWGNMRSTNLPAIIVSKHPALNLYNVEQKSDRGHSSQIFTSRGAAMRVYKKFLKENGGRNDL
jgi:hypothetical protein